MDTTLMIRSLIRVHLREFLGYQEDAAESILDEFVIKSPIMTREELTTQISGFLGQHLDQKHVDYLMPLLDRSIPDLLLSMQENERYIKRLP